MDYIRLKLNKHCWLKEISTILLKIMLVRASGNFLLYQISLSNPYYMLSTLRHCFLFSLPLLSGKFSFPLKYKIIDICIACIRSTFLISHLPSSRIRKRNVPFCIKCSSLQDIERECSNMVISLCVCEPFPFEST